MTFDSLGIKVKTGVTRWQDICPKCNESRKPENKKDKCLTVNNEPDNQWYNCNNFPCDFKGNLSNMEKYAKLMEKANFPKTGTSELMYSQEVTEFFKKRKIKGQTLRDNQVYEINNGMGWVICFPYYLRHQLVNVKFRPVKEKKFWQISKEDGSEKCFFGLSKLNIDTDPNRKKKNRLILLEGEIDLLTVKQCGFTNVLSVPEGAPSSDAKDYSTKFEFLTEPYTKELLSHVDEFILMTDDDAPGHHLRDYLMNFYGKLKCKQVTFPEGYKDSNEVYAGCKEKGLAELGELEVKKIVYGAFSFPIKGLNKASSAVKEIDEFANFGYKPGYKIGVGNIDSLISIKRGHTSVWTGVSGAGKSAFLRWYCQRLAVNNPMENLKLAVFAPETESIAREATKTMELYARKGAYKHGDNAMTDEQRMEALTWVDDHYVFINPSKQDHEFHIKGRDIDVNNYRSLRTILKYVELAKEQYGIYGYVIDTWNRTEDEMPRGETETKWIGKLLDEVDEFNILHNLHCYIVVHPTKMEQNAMGNFKVPGLYNIYGSSNWKNKVYLGVIIHRDKYKSAGEDIHGNHTYEIDPEAPTKIIVEKVKFEELGSEGSTKMWMDKSKGGIFVDEVVEVNKNVPPPEYKDVGNPNMINVLPNLMFDNDNEVTPF